MSEQVRSAVWGAIVGASLGAPLRGRKPFAKLNFYEPIPARMATNPALDAWIVCARHLRSGRGPQNLCRSYHRHWNYTVEETAFGLANLEIGFGAPMSGVFGNPLSDGSRGIGRACFWGLAFAGDPDRAGTYAYYDASMDHAGEGTNVAVAIARMVALAEPGRSPVELLRVAREATETSPQIRSLLGVVVEQAGPEAQPSVASARVAEAAGNDSLSARLALANLLLALSSGNGFSRTMLLAAGYGGPSDQVCIALGTILGMMGQGPDEEWTEPLGSLFVAGHGLEQLDPPENIADFVEWIERAVEPVELVLPVANPEIATEASDPPPTPEAEAQPTEPSTSENPTQEPAEAPVDEPALAVPTIEPPAPMSPQLRALLEQNPMRSTTAFEGVEVSAEHLDPPSVAPGKSLRLLFHFANVGDEEKTLEAGLGVPSGWNLASRLTTFRLRPGEKSSFPAVVQPSEGFLPPVSEITLQVNRFHVAAPLLAAERWFVVGPLANQDGMGFERSFRPETMQRRGDLFNGRSDLPVKWEELDTPGTFFDLEPMFRAGPGVLYLLAHMRLPRSIRGRLVVSAAAGVIAWVDGKRVIHYQDERASAPRSTGQVAASGTYGPEVRLLVKVVRNKTPIGKLVVYWLDEEGALVRPIEFFPLES